MLWVVDCGSVQVYWSNFWNPFELETKRQTEAVHLYNAAKFPDFIFFNFQTSSDPCAAASDQLVAVAPPSGSSLQFRYTQQCNRQHGCNTGATPTCVGYHGCWASLSRFCSGEEAGMRRPHEPCPVFGWCLALWFHTGMKRSIQQVREARL